MGQCSSCACDCRDGQGTEFQSMQNPEVNYLSANVLIEEIGTLYIKAIVQYKLEG